MTTTDRFPLQEGAVQPDQGQRPPPQDWRPHRSGGKGVLPCDNALEAELAHVICLMSIRYIAYEERSNLKMGLPP